MFHLFRRSSKKKPLRKNSTKWKLYLLLALLVISIASCGGNNGVKQSETETAPKETSSAEQSTPIRSLPVQDTHTSVLILHDSAGDWGYIGKEHAMLLENLLGHFDTSVRTQPVSLYQSGQLNQYSTIFYLGTSYDELSFYAEDSEERKSYETFLIDAKTTTKTLVWINHNLWQLAWDLPKEITSDEFVKQFGFSYEGLKNEIYNRIIYKGLDFKKGVVRFPNPGAVLDGCQQEADGQYACSPELNKVSIDNPRKVRTYASAYSSVNLDVDSTPYIIQSSNFWFVGDLPFLHHSIEDRYLIFADLLFDMLGQSAKSELKPAILRLDNIHPRSDEAKLEEVLNFLADENIPAAAAVSPLYVDNQQPDQKLPLDESPVGSLLSTHIAQGNLSIVAHGLSHQWEGGNNPHSGVTGDDFEFYRVSVNDDLSVNLDGTLPVDHADGNRTAERLQKAGNIFKQTALHSFAWAAPEYMAGETDYFEAQNQYPVHYGRLHYFSPQGPEGRFVGQMFPYAINKDRYNYRLIPENLGGIDAEPPTGYEVVSAEQILEHSKRLAAVRESIASIYFDITQPLEQLQTLVEGLREQGLSFIEPCTLGYSCRSQIPGKQWLTLKSRHLDTYLSAGTVEDINSDDIRVNEASEAVDQAWTVIQQDNHYLQLKSLKSGRCLVTDPTSQNGQQVSQGLCDENNQYQLWKQYGSDIRNRAIGTCLDVADDGTTVITRACDNQASQQWQLLWVRADG